MAISPVGFGVNLPAVESLSKTTPVTPNTDKGTAGFQRVVSEFLQDVNAQEIQADQALEQLVTGKTDNVHDVVLSLAEADLSFRLVLEIRNQLMESYQEIMRMQM